MYFITMKLLVATSLLFSSPLLSGLFSTMLFGKKPKKERIPGLLFHSLANEPCTGVSHYPAGQFRDLCILLKSSGISSVCVKDARATETAPDKRCLLTFDDGLESVYLHALPLLESYTLNATIFCLGSLFGELSSWDIYSGNRHCSRTQIRDMSDRGFEIGSHTISHPSLLYLRESAVRQELYQSKCTLEDITGKEVTSLSFPFGSWNRAIWKLAKECGYTAATLYRGKAYANENLFPVQGVYRFDSPEDIMQKIDLKRSFSIQRARSEMMSHFAQGTPAWKYRKVYDRC